SENALASRFWPRCRYARACVRPLPRAKPSLNTRPARILAVSIARLSARWPKPPRQLPMARPTRSRTRAPFTQGEILAPVAVLSQASLELYYDYNQLPGEHREAVRRSARIIKPLLKRTAE